MRWLSVGDVHAKPDELADCEALRRLILKEVAKTAPEMVCFLGDQYHMHALVNVEIQRFWMKFLAELRPLVDEIIMLIGNHDMPGDKNSSAHALQVHSSDVTVVDRSLVYKDMLFLSYFHDKDAFVAAAQLHPECATLVCHQTFDGARYENGFFAKEAIDPALVPQRKVVSGHIHSPARFGKVWYPGAPRYSTLADANVERAIYLIDGNSEVAIPTTPHVRAIWQLTDTMDGGGPSVEELIEAKVKAKDLVTVNLQGPRAWCETRKAELTALRSMRVRMFPTDGRMSKVRESEGIAVAFKKHLDAYRPKNSTSRDVLEKMAQERAHV